MIKAQANASDEDLAALKEAMEMPIESDDEKSAKIATVKALYAKLGVGEEAKHEIVRLHSSAMEYVSRLNLAPEGHAALHHYADTLLGRNK